MTRFSISQQIDELEREMKKRASVYPRQIASGRMRQSEADFFLGRMAAALSTLYWLRDNELPIKQRLAP